MDGEVAGEEEDTEDGVTVDGEAVGEEEDTVDTDGEDKLIKSCCTY